MCVYMQQLLRRLITGGAGYTVSSVGQPNEPQDMGGLGWIRICVQAVTNVCSCVGQLCSIPLSSQVAKRRFCPV